VAHSLYGKVMAWNILQAARAVAKKRIKEEKAGKKAWLSIHAVIKIFWQAWTENMLRISSAVGTMFNPRHARPSMGCCHA